MTKYEIIKQVNIIEDLKTHIQDISSFVCENEIQKKKENDYIKSTNEIHPRIY